MTGSKKNVITMLLAVLMLLPVMWVTAAATEPDKEPFSITVDMTDPEKQTVYDTQIYLYQVATATVDATGNLHMKPVELYQDLNFDSLTEDETRDLIDELCERLEYPVSIQGEQYGLLPKQIQKPGADGMIHFEDLDAGVYLLVKWSNEEPEKLEMLPTLAYLPFYRQESGSWERAVTVVPKFDWQNEPPVDPEPNVPDEKLPQTGMVQWPVPVLVISGLILVGVGYQLYRKTK